MSCTSLSTMEATQPTYCWQRFGVSCDDSGSRNNNSSNIDNYNCNSSNSSMNINNSAGKATLSLLFAAAISVFSLALLSVVLGWTSWNSWAVRQEVLLIPSGNLFNLQMNRTVVSDSKNSTKNFNNYGAISGDKFSRENLEDLSYGGVEINIPVAVPTLNILHKSERLNILHKSIPIV